MDRDGVSLDRTVYWLFDLQDARVLLLTFGGVIGLKSAKVWIEWVSICSTW
jgi:hypothetical protein